MKQCILLILLVFAIKADAYTISYTNDTVYVDKQPFLLLNYVGLVHRIFTIKSLTGKELIKVYSGKIEIHHQPAYILYFLNDSRKAMPIKDNNLPFIQTLFISLLNEHVIKNGDIDSDCENLFIKKFPVLKGYLDVEQLNEYG